jgi:hypothetical protein
LLTKISKKLFKSGALPLETSSLERDALGSKSFVLLFFKEATASFELI